MKRLTCASALRFSNVQNSHIIIPVTTEDLRPFTVTAENIRDMEGNSLEEPKTPQMKFTMQLPKAVPALSMIRRSVDLSAK